jgi:hypothetical protein
VAYGRKGLRYEQLSVPFGQSKLSIPVCPESRGLLLQPIKSAIESAQSSRTKEREAFFLTFSQAIRSHFPDLPLILTGGFRSRQGMAAAIQGGHCDMVGIGRPAILDPALPKNTILNPNASDTDRLYTETFEIGWREWLTGNKAVGFGIQSVSARPLYEKASNVIPKISLTKRTLGMVQQANPEKWWLVDVHLFWSKSRIQQRSEQLIEMGLSSYTFP